MLKPTAFRLAPGWERQSLRAPQAPKLSVRLKSSFAIFMEDAKKQQFFVFISPFSSVKLVNEVCIALSGESHLCAVHLLSIQSAP